MRWAGGGLEWESLPFTLPFPIWEAGLQMLSPPSLPRSSLAPGRSRPEDRLPPRLTGQVALAAKSSVLFFKPPRHMGANFSALRQDKEPSDGTGWAGSAPRRLARRRAGLLSRFGAVGDCTLPPAPLGFCPVSSPRQLLSPRPPPDLVPSF